MPTVPADFLFLPTLNDLASVRALALAFARGSTFAEVAADHGMDEATFLKLFGEAVGSLLGLTIDTVVPPPKGGVLVVSGESLDAVQLEGLHARFCEVLPKGTEVITVNYAIDTRVIGPLTDEHVLLVTGEDCDADDLEELSDQFHQRFPNQSMIIANFPIDVETMEQSQVKALQEYCSDILSLSPDEVLTGFMPEPENVLTNFSNLANRYVDALMRVSPGSGPRPDVEIDATSVGDKWRLRFIEKTEGADNILQEWGEDTLEKLTMWAESLVRAVEAMPTPVDMPNA